MLDTVFWYTGLVAWIFIVFGWAAMLYGNGQSGAKACEGGEYCQMTVWIYVDTSKRVGDRDHLKVFDGQAAAQAWSDQHDPEGVAFEYEVRSLMTTREAHDRFQQEVDHILDDLKRNP
ncbi:hypothetical protein [Bradyrhizobium sp. McL0615]|uniref:hypothetical protein n=1 Tax=Bradyrhizobium sp. McL0615 TaxID=3415673 RepID=UPI003CF4DAEF